MNYGQIRSLDIANGPGIRTTLFVTGCTHACPGCFNGDYQNPCFGDEYTDAQTRQLIENLDKDNIKGITVLGGEPFQNVDGLLEAMKKIRNFIDEYNLKHQNDVGYNFHKDMWVYSGYTYEEIIADQKMASLLEYFDVLIDGKFILKLLDLRLKFRGSSNQRIIDIKKTKATGSLIELTQYY
ncbi:MAG: anaerobic ribonucleoside-triphosphate reductase activating protein [Erysipelotrichaceae bacterium]|nr:anaerobic ribonucleoside-triphosphate reductase activating protein [Erysipelotrichaceae bacterium]